MQPVISVSKFAGASVTRIQSNIGWKEQEGSVILEVVEDQLNGDRFIPPMPGTPAPFSCGTLQFDGIVKLVSKSNSTSGYPTYNITLGSPSMILQNVQIILDAYVGVNLICPNLFNVYGYLENGGLNYGGSKKNENGTPWNLIAGAIQAIQVGGTQFGTPIQYKGNKYVLDLGGLPRMPDFYRLDAGVSVSLLEAISTICQDSSCDFIILLEYVAHGPHTIKFVNRSLVNQYPTGQIELFVEGRDDVISWDSGSENRNDKTSGVLIGGDLEEIIPQVDPGDGSVIYPFWGFTSNPFLLPAITQGNQPVNPSFGIGDFSTITFDATPIADLLGNGQSLPTYTCYLIELRFALYDFDSWAAYITRKRPDLATFFGVDEFPSIIGKDEITEHIESMYNASKNGVELLTDIYGEDSVQMFNLQKMYSFVRTQADNYLGRTFLVRIPFLLNYFFESETNNLNYSMLPNPDGGYWPDYVGGGATGPLGLYYQNFNLFNNNASSYNGKLGAYVKFSGPDVMNNGDITNRSQTDMVFQQGDGIYIKCNMDNGIIFSPTPAILISLSEPLWAAAQDPIGGVAEVAWLLDMDQDDLVTLLQLRDGNFPIGIHPKAFMPNGAAICLKSNELTYGPWTNIGVPGETVVIHQPDLTPWNYGGFDTMNQAALDQLAAIGSTNQLEESGSIKVAGIPADHSVAEQLNGNGPIITSVDVTIDASEISTTYTMRSQTPVFGTFAKENAKRIRNLGLAAQETRSNLRNLFTRIAQTNNTISQGNARGVLEFASQAIQQKRDMEAVLFSTTYINPVTGNVEVTVQAMPRAKAIGNSNAHDDSKFQMAATMGLEGVFRPFSTDANASGIPKIQSPTAGNIVNSTTVDAFKAGHDLRWAANGASYTGFYAKDVDSSDGMRVLGQKGPLYMVGFGYDVGGNPIPNQAEIDSPSANMRNFKTTFSSGYLSDLAHWKAGPVDLRWNKFKGMWTAPGAIFGTANGDITVSAGSGYMTVEGTSDVVKVKSWYSMQNTITNGTKMHAIPSISSDVLYIAGVDCTN